MANFLIVRSNSMFYKIYSHMSLMNNETKWCFLLKIKSANGELKSMAKKVFKKLEHFSINEIEGVILEWRIEKN